MKRVMVVIGVMVFSFCAAAQTTDTAAGVPQKVKKGKVQAARPKGTTTTLKDEKAYPAKWSFEEMLRRRVEADAREAERKKEGNF